MAFLIFVQAGDFVLVELPYEEGKQVGSYAHYVAQVLTIEEDGRLYLSFLRLKSSPMKDTYSFPPSVDKGVYDVGNVKGVLVITRGGTKRQEGLIKVFPPPWLPSTCTDYMQVVRYVVYILYILLIFFM